MSPFGCRAVESPVSHGAEAGRGNNKMNRGGRSKDAGGGRNVKIRAVRGSEVEYSCILSLTGSQQSCSRAGMMG